MSTLAYVSADGGPARRSAAVLLWRRLSRNAMSLAALAVLVVVALTAVGAPVIMPYDPDEPDAEHALEAPSGRHWLGTDLYGRDQLTRIVHAGRVDLLVALAATAIALSIGSVLGAVSGYRGGWIDQLLMRVIDTIQAFPSFILAMGIAAALGNSVTNIVIAIAITHVPIYGRLIRGEMLRIREMEYAEAARTVGNPRRRIIFHHLLPNCLPPVIVQATLAMGFAILTVAALSYIGLGIRPPTSEWGAMTAEGAGYIVSGEWWVFLFPGTAIMATVLSFNLVGDALRDVLDPRMKGV
ncbi:MAG TPA: ABC transporter permease [Candidatus Dormibacteraeota bacterium]|nr:ABC transporter permease [Candidatus Dormibacteraeota bacterium]